MMASSKLLLSLLTVFQFIFNLDGLYVRQGTPTAFLHKPMNLTCQYSGSDSNGEFAGWFRDGVQIVSDKKSPYDIQNTANESTLFIKHFTVDDANVEHWYVKTNKAGDEEPADCRFNKIVVISSPQTIRTDRAHEKLDAEHRSVRRNLGESVRLFCDVLPKRASVDPSNPVQWHFGQDDNHFGNLPDGVRVDNEELAIDSLDKRHRGYYQCSLNQGKANVLMRVKDRFAALWPFIGIVSAVIVFVTIILILEKRGKFLQKPVAADGDNQDHANDPLVRVTHKGTDDENKQRAINT